MAKNRNPYFTEDCPRVLVGERAGGMVELLIDDDYAIFIPASEARGLAAKLVIIAYLADGKSDG